MSAGAWLRERVGARRVFYGWYIVWAGLISNIFTIGITAWGFGVLIEQFRKEFSWSVKAIALGYSIRSFETGVLSPVTGYMNDRLGPRRTAIIGTALMGIALLLFSKVNGLPLYFTASALLAFGQSIGGLSAYTRAVMAWFVKKRGRAVGLMNTGNALGYFAPVIMASIVAALGWREALVICGFVVIAVGVPLAFVVRDTPESMGLLPDGEQATLGSGAGTAGRRTPQSGTGLEVKEALKTPAFYLLLLAGGVEGFSHGPWVTFNIPHLQTAGYSVQAAGLIVAGYGLVQVPLRFGASVLADAVGRRRLYIASYVIQAAGLVSFAFMSPTRLWLVPIYWLTMGMAHAGLIAGRDSVVADYFGTKRFGTLRGLRQAMLLPVSILAPLFMGAMFDNTQSYRVGFMVLALVGVTGALWLGLIRRPLWKDIEIQPVLDQAAK